MKNSVMTTEEWAGLSLESRSALYDMGENVLHLCHLILANKPALMLILQKDREEIIRLATELYGAPNEQELHGAIYGESEPNHLEKVV